MSRTLDNARSGAYLTPKMQPGSRQALPLSPPGVDTLAPPMAPSPNAAPSNSLVRIVSPDQLQEQERQKAIAAERQAGQNAQTENSLLALVRRKWGQAKDAKRRVEQIMLEDQRQRNSEYDPQELGILQEQNQPIIYMRLSAIKAKAAVAWLSDIMFQGDDHPWSLKPTPIPEISPELVQQIAERAVLDAMAVTIQQQQPIPPQAIQMHAARIRQQVERAVADHARETANGMTRVIADQFAQCGFYDTLAAFLDDIVTFPLAVLKAPVIRNSHRLTWQRTNEGFVPVKKRQITTTVLRVSPFDIYVTDETTDFQTGPVFERMRMGRDKVLDCIGVDGFREAELRTLLDRSYARGKTTWQTTDSERAQQEYRDNQAATENDQIELIEGWLQVSGKMLIENGVTMAEAGPIDPIGQYEVCIWFQENGTEIPYLVINDHPLGMRPYSGDSYERIPGAFWGRSLCRTMRDKQSICNAAARAICRNMEWSSGPQAAIDDVARLPADEKVTEIYAGKIWQFNNERQSTNDPIKFFVPPTVVAELMAVYDKFASEVDNDTGIPAYSYGSDEVSGAGKTLGGLSILSNNAARGLRLVMSHVDKVIREVVERQYHHNMLFHDDDSIKGDLEVVTRGAMAVVQAEQLQVRRMQFLQVTNNPVDLQIVGLIERSNILRETAKSLQLPVEDVVPPPEVMQAKMLATNAMAALQAENEPPSGKPGKEKPKEPAP